MPFLHSSVYNLIPTSYYEIPPCRYISVARQAGLIFVGGDDGFARIFDYSTGAYRGQLEHGHRGDRIISVTVSL